MADDLHAQIFGTPTPPSGLGPLAPAPAEDLHAAIFRNPRSALGEISSQAVGGLVGEVPKQAGQALQYISEPGQSLYETGKGWAEAAEKRLTLPQYQPHPEEHGAVVNALASGARMLAPSVAAPLAVGAGLAALPEAAIGGTAALGLSALAGSVPAALQQGQQTLEDLRAQGVPEEDARAAARRTAAIEGAGETLGTYAGGKLFGIGARALSKAAPAGEAALAGATAPGLVRPFVKQLGETAATEVGTEIGQAAGQAAVERAYGGKGPSPLEAAGQVVGPTLGMTALLAPFGLAGFVQRNRMIQKRAADLASEKTDPAARTEAAAAIAREIHPHDPTAAAQFHANVMADIQAGAPIALGPELLGPRAAPVSPPLAPPPPLGPVSRALDSAGATPSAPILPATVPQGLPLGPLQTTVPRGTSQIPAGGQLETQTQTKAQPEPSAERSTTAAAGQRRISDVAAPRAADEAARQAREVGHAIEERQQPARGERKHPGDDQGRAPTGPSGRGGTGERPTVQGKGQAEAARVAVAPRDYQEAQDLVEEAGGPSPIRGPGPPVPQRGTARVAQEAVARGEPRAAAVEEIKKRGLKFEGDGTALKERTILPPVEQPGALPVKSNADLKQAKSDRAYAATKLFGNEMNRQAVIKKGFDGFSQERQAAMVRRVRGAIGQGKVLRAIIETVPVDVVNNLTGGQWSPNDLRHNRAVLQNTLAIDRNRAIPAPVGRFIEAIAGRATKTATESAPAGLDTGLVPGERRPTGKASTIDKGHITSPESGTGQGKAGAETPALPPSISERSTPPPRETQERRKDVAERKRVAAMTPDEMRRALLIDDLTGLGNKRAWQETEKGPVLASLDLDSLKFVNDMMGHASGDKMLAAMGKALNDVMPGQAFHVSGDEFLAHFEDQKQADRTLGEVADLLNQATVSVRLPDGTTITKTGVGYSYGTGTNLQAAEDGLQRHKAERERTGLRAARGGEPAGVARTAPEGQPDRGREAAEEAVGPRYSYLGKTAALANHSALGEAIALSRTGTGMEDIREKTGWFKGKDEEWRFEISDKDAKLKEGWHQSDYDSEKVLANVLSHNKLYENYPALINIRFSIADLGDTQGYFNSTTKRIELNSSLNEKDARSVLLHEIQHVVQTIERFARGGSTRSASVQKVALERYGQEYDALEKRLHKIQDLELDWILKHENEYPSRYATKEAHDAKFPQVAKELARMRERIGDLGYTTRFKAYERLLGEVEARDVQVRKDMGEKERRLIEPYVSQGIREEDFIIDFTGKAAASQEAPTTRAPIAHTAESLKAELREALGAPATARLLRSTLGIVERDDQLPSRLQHRKGGVRGVFDPGTGKTWFVAGNVHKGEAKGLALHEIGTHAGMESMLGLKLWAHVLAQVDGALGQIEPAAPALPQRYSPEFVAAVKAARARVPNDTRAWLVTEETIANLVEDPANHDLPLVKRILAAIRAFLLRMGVPLRQISPDDLVALARAAVRSVSRGETVSLQIDSSGRNISADQVGVDFVVTDTKLFGNTTNAEAIRAKGFDSLDRKSKKFVLTSMRAALHDSEIARPIIESAPRSMMDQFIGSKISTEKLLHDPTMFRNRFPVAPDVPVTVAGLIDFIATLKQTHAFDTAKQVAASGMAFTGLPVEGRTADGTIKSRHGVPPEQGAVSGAPGREPGAPILPRRVSRGETVQRGLAHGEPAPAYARAAQNRDIRYSRGTPPPLIARQDSATQEALRKAGVIYHPPTLAARVRAWLPDWQRRVRQGLVDAFDPIKKYDYKAYMQARLTKGADAGLEGLLKYGTLRIDADGAIDVNYEKGGFLGLMKQLDGEHDLFFGWVAGNRAKRIMEEGKAALARVAALKDELRSLHAQRTAASQANDLAGYKRIQSEIMAAGKELVIARERANVQERNFNERDIEKLIALSDGKMADGRSRADVYGQMNKELQRYNRSVMDLAEQAGLIDAETRPFWERDFYVPFYRLMEEEDTKGPVTGAGLIRQYAFKHMKGGKEVLGDPFENTLKNWSHLISASLKNQAGVTALNAAEAQGAAEVTASTTKGAIWVRKAGKPVYYTVSDPLLLDAVKALNAKMLEGPAMKAMSAMKRALTLGVTIAPAFRVRNLLRDTMQAIGTSELSYNMLGNVLQGWKGTKEGSANFAQLLAGGGVMRFGTWLEGDRAANVKRLIESGVASRNILTNQARIQAMLVKGWRYWQSTGERAENVNRSAIYQQARARGASHLEASYLARDLMDFSMQGTWGAIRMLTQMVPFMNARMQGLYKLGRAYQEDPVRLMSVTGAVAAASIMLAYAYGDDDDWKAREDWDRDNNWWFKIGNEAYWIPKPFEIGAIASMAERGYEALTNPEFGGRDFADRMGAILWSNLSLNPIPQLFKPLVELYANKDTFTDRPIETEWMKKLSVPLRVAPETSASAQVLGKAGVLSPVQIDHLARGYFGWLGSHVVLAADLFARPVLGLADRPAWRTENYPLLGDFAKDLPAYQNRYVTKFYDQAEKVQQALGDLKHYRDIGAMEQAKELKAERGEMLRKGPLVRRTMLDLGKINGQIRKVQQMNLSAEAKRARLDRLYQQRNEKATRASRALEATP